MAFFYTGDPQVRLRFSRYAQDVIQNDMFVFHEPRRNSFLNTILENFYAEANASISLRLSEYEDFLLSQFASSTSNKEFRPFINKLLETKSKELLNLANSYGFPQKESSNQPLRLRKEFYHFMTDSQTGSCEEAFYKDSLPKYLRTIIEEYTRLPYISREKIFYQNIFSIITEALLTQKQLLITTANDLSFHVIPYKLMTDPLATANYLTGFSYSLTSDKTQKKSCSFRISTIKNIKIEKSKSGHLTSKDIELLELAISKQGVQFLISDCEEIKVKFTDEGLIKFKRQVYLRPTPLEAEPVNNIHTFKCSFSQALFYFIKFGKDAEVLSPDALRRELIENYRAALEQYNSKG